MIRYYANKIVEDGIKDCYEFSNLISIYEYENIEKYKNEICPYYYDKDLVIDEDYFIDQSLEKNLLEEFFGYYARKCLFNNPYISIRNLMNQFAEEQTDNQENRTAITNMIKKNLNESNFLEKNIDGIEVYITPKNYKELEQVIEECLQNFEQEELE